MPVTSRELPSVPSGSDGTEGPHKLVVIDDDPASIELVAEVLKQPGLEIIGATDAPSGLASVKTHRPELVLLDLVIPDVKGLELMERILEIDTSIDVILMTAHYSTDSAVEAIQKGAYDYLTKPLAIDKLRAKVDKWMGEVQLRERALKLDGDVISTYQFEGIIGRSPLMLELFSKMRRIAPHFQTVLVTGETGTGKELVAQALHRLSPYAAGPFVVCNCAAIAETLVESELFGHVKGAFTGATHDKQGLVECANGGTLFLDEIGEMPIASQAKLLRAVQNREVQRLGAPGVRKVDVRVIAATNRDLRAMVRDTKFREDLFYRLSMVELRTPRLNDRMEDLPLLERHFLDLFATRYAKPTFILTRQAQALMASYSWPGNVREIENVLGYACMMAEQETIDLRDFPEPFRNQLSSQDAKDEELVSLEELERKHTLKVLERVGGNRFRAAEILGISRATLYRLIASTRSDQETTRKNNQSRDFTPRPAGKI